MIILWNGRWIPNQNCDRFPLHPKTDHVPTVFFAEANSRKGNTYSYMHGESGPVLCDSSFLWMLFANFKPLTHAGIGRNPLATTLQTMEKTQVTDDGCIFYREGWMFIVFLYIDYIHTYISDRFKSYRSGRSRIILRARSVLMTLIIFGNSSCIIFAVVRSTLLLLDFLSEYFVLS